MTDLAASRKSFLEYLRAGFGHGQDYHGLAGDFTYQQVLDALKQFSKSDPASWNILYNWITTRLDLSEMAKKHSWPAHTLKRRLYACVDALLAKMRLEPLVAVDKNYSVLSNCEVFHETVLKFLEKNYPGVEKQILSAMRMGINSRRRSKRKS